MRLVSPDGGEVRDIAPGAAAVTLGAWSPGGRQLGVTVFAGGRRRRPGLPGRPARRHVRVLAAGPAARVCAVSGDGRRAVVRLGRRGARDAGAGRPAHRAAHRAAPGRRRQRRRRPVRVTGRQLYVHTDAGRDRARAARRHAAARTRCPSSTRSPSAPDDDLDLVALDPSGRARRAGLERRRAQRDRAARPALRAAGAAGTRVRATSSPGRRSPGTAARCWWPARARRCRRGCRASRSTAGRRRPAGPGRARRGPAGAALVAPTLHKFAAEDGLPLSGWLFRPARRAGPAAHAAVAARRPGGAGAADVPAAVPGAARRGRRGVRAERARLRRLRAQLHRRRRPRPAVRRHHRRAGGRRLPGRPPGSPTPPGSACRAAPTAAT